MYPAAARPQKYYFSDKLKERLNRIPQHPLTIVEAPSGFGKTTAVREYLRTVHPEAARAWHTCLGESALAAWLEICALFAEIGDAKADDLKNLKLPAPDTLCHIGAALKALECRREAYLVIDNCQLLPRDMLRALTEAFSLHENPRLHTVLITNQIDSGWLSALHNDSVYTISTASFFFDREGIAGLFRIEGLRLSQRELERVFRSTEGWISAIRLQMRHYRETGCFMGPAGIEQVVKTAIWIRMTPAEKDFLLSVSVFDSFTAQQAAAMLDNEVLPDGVEEKLKTSDFIRFLPDKRLFVIHSILLDYLRNQFHYHQPEEFRTRVLRKAGLSCAAMGAYCPAAKFFYQIGDFEAILSLPFTLQYLDAQRGIYDEALFMGFIRACPDDVFCQYPAAMAVFAHHVLLSGKYGIYQRLCGLLRTLTAGTTRLPREQIWRITGELISLEALGSFNDLAKIRAVYERVRALWEETPEITENSTPWFSIFPTTFGMLWREPGRLDALLCAIDEMTPLHRAFGRGQDAGLAHLIRAEVLLAQGADSEAEIRCHEALYEARGDRQTSIRLFAELCLARVFILRGDTQRFLAAMRRIQDYAADPESAVRRMADLCLSIISLLLGVKDYVAPWLYDMESVRKFLYVPVVPFAEVLHSELLLLDRRYNELYALSQLSLEALEQHADVKYRLLQLYHVILFAVGKYKNGEKSQARRYLTEALDMAAPDGVYLPFADHDCMVSLLTELDMLRPGGRGPNRDAALLTLCKRQAGGVGAIRKALLQTKSPLTPREREVALLAKARLSAKEIAAELYISERTVTTTLGNVYGKLGIHSKSALRDKDF